MKKQIMRLLLLAGVLVFVYGFDLDNATVPREQILSGGVPKDGIPAILKPVFIDAGEAQFLDDKDHVIGVKVGIESRAYPINILNWHEVVNDTISGLPIAVTF